MGNLADPWPPCHLAKPRYVYYATAVESELDVVWLFASVVIGAIGLGMFLYGKKRSRFIPLLAGILMMVYPYFIPNTYVMIGIGVGISGFVWLSRR